MRLRRLVAVTFGRLGMGILAVAVAMTLAMRLVHAFVQHLGAFPGMLVAGDGAKQEGEGGEGGGFHGR